MRKEKLSCYQKYNLAHGNFSSLQDNTPKKYQMHKKLVIILFIQ